jgi:CMP-N,N'-diacetyllegionaminic acid synthase
MKPICIIPARGGSKGVPKKNIRIFAGKPLIAHTIENAIKSKLFSEVIVSTDNEEIANISKKYNAKVPFMRPKKYATDNAAMNEVLLHAITELYSLGYNFESLVYRDCTVPFIRNNDIKKSISILKKSECDLVAGVYRQHLNPYFNMMELKSSGFLQFSKKLKKQITRRQDAPIVYQLNGLLTLNVNQFLKYKKIYMPKIIPVEIPPETGFMIDTEFEFKLGELIIKKKLL